MNWELAGILAEIISAFAVVATLIFLGLEVRNNRNATESMSIDALAVGFNNLNTQLVGDSEFFEIFFSALGDPTNLSDINRARVLWMIQSYINHLTTVKKYHDSGALPEEEWDAYIEGTAQVLNTPGGKWGLANVAITPSLLAEIRKFEGAETKDGFLGLEGNG